MVAVLKRKEHIVSELTPELIEGLKRNAPPQSELESIEILSSDPGSVRYAIDVPDSVLNYHGTIHGGFVSTLMEIAAGMATYAYGVSNVALACSTNFIRAVGAGRLAVAAETSHKGRSTAVVHCAIEDGQGRLVAESTYTMFILGPLS